VILMSMVIHKGLKMSKIPVLQQYVQIHRSQGADGPPTEHEKIVREIFWKIHPHRSALLTPYLWFANGWVECLKYLEENSHNGTDK
jgi:hypothetical protein